MLAVGYIDERQVFIVRNSWGPEWVRLNWYAEQNDNDPLPFQGDAGYVYMPYAYMTNPKLAFDAFTIQKFSSFDLGQEHWKNDVSEMQLGEPSTFGASIDDEKDDWSFQELDDGKIYSLIYLILSHGWGDTSENASRRCASGSVYKTEILLDLCLSNSASILF